MSWALSDEIYNVVSTNIFDLQWNDLVDNGCIDQIIRPSDFVELRKRILGSRPWIGAEVPGKPAHWRGIRFPSYMDIERNLEIWYSIIEDDLKVCLEEIREVYTFGI